MSPPPGVEYDAWAMPALRRAHRLCRTLPLLLCGLAAAGHGAPLFGDGFESGDLASWDDAFTTGRQNDLSSSRGAAHRGEWGLRLVDQSGHDSERVEGRVEKALAPAESFHLRYWFRFSARSFGPVWLSRAYRPDFEQSFADVILTAERTLLLAGHVRNGNFVVDDTGFQMDEDTWYLLEVALTGLGTEDGGRTLWVNGERQASRHGLNFSRSAVGHLALGEPYTNRGTFRGVLDFDDVYADGRPLPSRLALGGPDLLSPGACVELTVSLVDSVAGAPAPAPYAITAALSVIGGGAELFSDAACQAATQRVAIAAGVNAASVFLRAREPGQLVLMATHVDFLPGEHAAAVVPIEAPLSRLGDTCSGSSQCASGHCVDGVCCDSACEGACAACSIKIGGETNGTCSLLGPGTTCRAASGACDVEERCTGQSPECPADAFASQATVCRASVDVCDAQELCTGASEACPADALAPAETVCRAGAAGEPAASCSGTSAACPDISGLPSLPSTAGEGTPQEGLGCQTPDCVEVAELGCSCRSGSGEALLAGLAVWMVLLTRGRHTARSRGP